MGTCDVRKKIPRRQGPKVEQTPVERMTQQARKRLRSSEGGQRENNLINMNWHDSSHRHVDVRTHGTRKSHYHKKVGVD